MYRIKQVWINSGNDNAFLRTAPFLFNWYNTIHYTSNLKTEYHPHPQSTEEKEKKCLSVLWRSRARWNATYIAPRLENREIISKASVGLLYK